MPSGFKLLIVRLTPSKKDPEVTHILMLLFKKITNFNFRLIF